MSPPKISVLIPVYNSARYLRAALQSVCDQTERDWEMIVVDDGSTDETPAILAQFAATDPRIRIISRANTGIVGALNDALSAARGKYLARMDGDDLSLPERFAKQAAYLEENARCVIVGTHVLRIDPAGLPIGPEPQPLDHSSILTLLLEGAAGTLTHPSVMMRRDAVLAAGGYRPAYEWAEDYDLFLRLAEHGTLANLPQTLLQYRLHHESVNMRKRDLQGQRAALCLSEACARRGIPDRTPTALLGWLAKSRDPLTTRRGWARRALACGNFPTAQKHAWGNILAQPWNPAWWKLFALATLRRPRLPFRSKLRAFARPRIAEATP